MSTVPSSSSNSKVSNRTASGFVALSTSSNFRQPGAKVQNAPRKPAQKTRAFATVPPFIHQVAERITRDWLRGVSELSISKTYGRTRECIEETVRGQVKTMLAENREAPSWQQRRAA